MSTQKQIARLFPVLLLLILAAACRTAPAAQPTAVVTVISATPVPTETAVIEPTEPPPTDEPAVEPVEPEAATPEPTGPLGQDLELVPGVIDYNLGDAAVTQDRFPADSGFRDMPVRLEGLLALPDDAGQPAPVVMILHGNHFGCPTDPDRHGVDPWPCDREVEQLNYRGFDYLARALADQGYIVLAPNVNAEYTLGFGEGDPSERIGQIIPLHLNALREASEGGDNAFGVDLTGRVDMGRLAFIGHSQGGEFATALTRSKGWDSPYALVDNGFGPVDGVLMIAPANNFVGTTESAVPLVALLPQCDGDVVQLDGQNFYEALRADPNFTSWAGTVFMERANHNGFNRILRADASRNAGCETIMPAADQQAFLAAYAADFLAALWSAPPARVEAMARLDMAGAAPAAATMYGQAVRPVSLAPVRQPLLLALNETEVEEALSSGRLAPDGIEAVFCPAGFFTSFDNPLAETCRRPNVTQPGNPAQLRVDWTGPGALRLSLPAAEQNVSAYSSLRLRAALDPLSELNAPGEPQSFSVVLTDTAGESATVIVPTTDPALQFPPGEREDVDFLEAGLFRGLVHMSDIRLPLDAFTGVDLTSLATVELVFDQTGSGTLMLADLEFVRPENTIGAYSTLLENADGQNDALKAVGRLFGRSTCTATLVDVGGGPDAPAYVISNGHCAQTWDGNEVFTALPADSITMVFNFFQDTADATVEVPGSQVVYSTMKGRDLSIIELATTVGELAAQDITPLSLGAAPDAPFTARVIGAPVTGVPNEIAFLRQEACSVSGAAGLFEFIWHFNDALRNSCQDIYGGSSGSPLFALGSDDVVALINTTSIGGVTPCAAGVPCEATSDGTQLLAGTSYATPLAGLGACFVDGRFDLTLPDCPLDDGRQLLISGHPSQPIQPTATGSDGQTVAASWNATLSGDLPYYRYKIGPAGPTDCRVDEGYGEVVALGNQQVINDPLPPEEGSTVLCVLAGDTPVVDESWQPVEQATLVRAEIDTTPPVLVPFINIHRFGEDISFEPIFVVPELSDFRIKFGPPETTDCSVSDDYFIYRRIPVRVPADQLPAKICVIGADVAGNAGEPVEHIVTAR
jgi:dienelactone hydrolase